MEHGRGATGCGAREQEEQHEKERTEGDDDTRIDLLATPFLVHERARLSLEADNEPSTSFDEVRRFPGKCSAAFWQAISATPPR